MDLENNRVRESLSSTTVINSFVHGAMAVSHRAALEQQGRSSSTRGPFHRAGQRSALVWRQVKLLIHTWHSRGAHLLVLSVLRFMHWKSA